MAVYTCPKGHSSTENDYCSECGAKIDGAASPAATKPPPAGSPARAGIVTCPDCSVNHSASAGDYCEVCGYNFKTGAHGELALPQAPVVAPTPTPTPPPTPTPAPPAPTPVTSTDAAAPPTTQPPPPDAKILGWEVSIAVDPSLKVDGSPDPPADVEPVLAALRPGSNLIGRTSPRRGIHPEVPLDLDDAVSHRHALLEVHGDGTLTLRDIGSSNGTSVNGKEIAQLTDVSINDGDAVTLGHWTRLLVKAVR